MPRKKKPKPLPPGDYTFTVTKVRKKRKVSALVFSGKVFDLHGEEILLNFTLPLHPLNKEEGNADTF